MGKEEVQVKIDQGVVEGKICENCVDGKPFYSFTGIPYARAPCGDLKFKAPLPPEKFTKVFNAKKPGEECPSIHPFFMLYTGKEDNCLNLNVFTPKLGGDEPLKPVMVFIHGGGFTQGSNRKVYYGPDYLLQEDVVLVSINYRLGVLGFLSLEDPSLDVPGNAGLKDQVMALKWIKKNIRGFGGDPDNVTIFGESAGAASCHLLVMSPMAKGLFHKAIMQSGSALNPWAQGQRGNGKIIADKLGIKFSNEKDLLKQLNAMPSKRIINANWKIFLFYACEQQPFSPIVENTPHGFLTEDPLVLMKSGNFNQVPIIFGFNSNEGLLYSALLKFFFKSPDMNLALNIPHKFGVENDAPKTKEIVQKMRTHFARGGEEVKMKELVEIKSDSIFVHGIHRAVNVMRQSSQKPIYYYKFSFEGNLNLFKKALTSKCFFVYVIALILALITSFSNFFITISEFFGFNDTPRGACHVDEIGYLFPTKVAKVPDEHSREAKMVRRMTKMWANFARFGNPTEKRDKNVDIIWEAVKKDSLNFLEIDDDLRMDVSPFGKRMQFWDGLYSTYLKK